MSTPALKSIPSLYHGYHDGEYIQPYRNTIGAYAPVETHKSYDVFISHASEDKSEVARPLANMLEQNGLSVWYDDFQLRIGDSLRQKIDQGIAKSSFGIIVISPDFIRKGWTGYELDGIVAKANSGTQGLLPIWHRVTKQQVIDFSPSIAGRVARSTSEFTISEIADEITDFIISHEEEYDY